MQRNKWLECSVGLFVLLAFICLIYLALRVSGLTPQRMEQTYTLYANFSNIGNLRPNARVTMAGVTVGKVTAIKLDKKWLDAQVTLQISNELKDRLTTDTAAAILTAGLIGEQYIGLTDGADPEFLHANDTIRNTQSSLVLENLIQQVVASLGKH